MHGQCPLDTRCIACIQAVLQIADKSEFLSGKTHNIEPTSYLCQWHCTVLSVPILSSPSDLMQSQLRNQSAFQVLSVFICMTPLHTMQDSLISGHCKNGDNSPEKPYTTMTRSNTSGPTPP